jgi:S-adenosylmethionine:tRNA ribosyltransferase-isomerase
MHCEHFFVTRETIELILNNYKNIIAVGTTSVRTLESLYWLGARLLTDITVKNPEFSLGQWEPYEMEKKIKVSVTESLEALLNHLKKRDQSHLHASTNMIIIPGYEFRMIKGMITNFHQPRSTLLLLVSAWIGKNWKEIYKFAYGNNFRFLSYGDSSLLIR